MLENNKNENKKEYTAFGVAGGIIDIFILFLFLLCVKCGVMMLKGFSIFIGFIKDFLRSV